MRLRLDSIQVRERYLLWALVCVASGALLSAHLFFFPLKQLMHSDEIVRYAYGGVELFQYSLYKMFAPLGTLDNGRTIVVTLRLIRHFLFSSNVAATFALYKDLVFVFTLGTIYWFCRTVFMVKSRVLALTMLLFFIAAPMTWIQANEIMCEPLALPLSLIWMALAIQITRKRRLMERKGGVVIRFLVISILFMHTSLQFFTIYSCLATLTSFLVGVTYEPWKRASWKPNELVQRFYSTLWFSGVGAAVFAFWVVSRFVTPWSGRMAYLKFIFGVSDHDFSALQVKMTAWDVFAFGSRTFGWFYFPALLLLIPAAVGIVRWFKEFSEGERLVIGFSVLQIPLYAYGYRHCLQERYFHLPNTLLLCVVALGLYHWFCSWRASRSALALLAAGFATYAAFDYAPVFRRLPCFANMQVYGPYAETDGVCETIPAFFHSMPRTQLVAFPHLHTTYFFPNLEVGKPKMPLGAMGEIRQALQKGYYPHILDGAPNYLNQRTVEMEYLTKFNTPLPDPKGPTLFISVSLPKVSPYLSTIYADLESQSVERALAAWKGEVLSRPHEMVVDNWNNEYVCLIAKTL